MTFLLPLRGLLFADFWINFWYQIGTKMLLAILLKFVLCDWRRILPPPVGFGAPRGLPGCLSWVVFEVILRSYLNNVHFLLYVVMHFKVAFHTHTHTHTYTHPHTQSLSCTHTYTHAHIYYTHKRIRRRTKWKSLPLYNFVSIPFFCL